MNDISPGVNYMYTQLMVEGTTLFELNVTQMKLDGQTGSVSP